MFEQDTSLTNDVFGEKLWMAHSLVHLLLQCHHEYPCNEKRRKKNFPATCSHTQDNPHPTMAKVTMVTGFYLSGQKEN